jgi:hypothetical protein
MSVCRNLAPFPGPTAVSVDLSPGAAARAPTIEDTGTELPKTSRFVSCRITLFLNFCT